MVGSHGLGVRLPAKVGDALWCEVRDVTDPRKRRDPLMDCGSCICPALALLICPSALDNRARTTFLYPGMVLYLEGSCLSLEKEVQTIAQTNKQTEQRLVLFVDLVPS